MAKPGAHNIRPRGVGVPSDSDEVSQILTVQFGDKLDAEIIESVLEECQYDFELSSKNLYDMLGIGQEQLPQQINTTMQGMAAVSSQSDLQLPLIPFAQKGYRVMIILRGLPGSGKSTLGKQILNEIMGACNPRDYIFTADDFFMYNGEYRYNSFQVKDAHDWVQKRAYDAMRQGISPVMIDNTNTQIWEMKPYVMWAVENGYRIYIREPNTTWMFRPSELARKNKHNVPKDKIIDMLDRYDKQVTVERLLTEFQVYYGYLKPPMLRNYPPVKNKEPSSRLQITEVSKVDAMTSTRDGMTLSKSKEIFSTGTFINNGQLPPRYPRAGFFDKGTEVTEDDFDDESMIGLSSDEIRQKAVDALANMFVAIPHEYLEDILLQCNGDLAMCIDVLLDDPKQLLDYQPPAKTSCLGSGEVVFDVESGKAVAGHFDEACGMAKNVGTVTRGNHSVMSPLNSTKKVNWKKPQDDKSPSHKVKRFLESNVVINQEHYGPVVSKLKGLPGLEIPEVEPMFSDNSCAMIQNQINMIDNEDLDPDDTLSEDSERPSIESQNDDMLELNLGSVLVEQLNQLFGNPDFQLPNFYSPVVEIPRKLAEQLHALYQESMLKQMECQQHLYQQMLAEDEEMQMKLQMEEIRMMEEHGAPDFKQIMKDQAEAQRNQKLADNQWRNLTPQNMADKMTKQKLSACFPNVPSNDLEEIYNAHANNFDETVAALKDSGLEYVENIQKTISAGTLQEMQAAHDLSEEAKTRDSRGFEDREPSSTELRQEAASHQKQRVDLLNKAKQYYSKGMTEVAMFYTDLARQQTRMWEKYNSMAAVQIVNEGFHRSNNSDTIDLHYLRVKEAVNALDIYIDEVINQMQTAKRVRKDIFVITGRGKNSPNGIPRIRPGVEQRLKKRALRFNRVNDGLLKVQINKNSLMTVQLPQ